MNGLGMGTLYYRNTKKDVQVDAGSATWDQREYERARENEVRIINNINMTRSRVLARWHSSKTVIAKPILSRVL